MKRVQKPLKKPQTAKSQKMLKIALKHSDE